MQNSDNQVNNQRRDFIKLTVLGTAGAACGSAFCSCSGDQTEPSDGEKVQLLSPDGELVEIDKKHVNPVHKTCGVSTEESRIGIPGRKFVMVVDLAKCNNARKCITACQKMHHLPEETEWLQVKLLMDSPDAAPYWFPKTCFHCDNPPCVKVCPVDATFKRQDGLVLIDNERCIGCKFCMAACPYSTRVFNWDEPEQPEEIAGLTFSPETSVPSQIGTVEKCDFCPDMTREGLLPDCVTACPNGVFYYGDQNEDVVSNGTDVVRFSDLITDRAGYRYMEELGTEPRVWYLPPVDRIFPVERSLEELPDDIRERFRDVM